MDISGLSLTVIILGLSLIVIILRLSLSLQAELILCISSCNSEVVKVTNENNEALKNKD
ncbi:11695_t:CDS:2 [Diversispora eburnea]|uniref:11695_t:CDS:1 n=1 Tax=Diversispora eburnea TaxID=1213867 RepID=A0A9N9GA26_9GLOM|nr:11695_t:CDS:2 [Diversispora eburnea]